MIFTGILIELETPTFPDERLSFVAIKPIPANSRLSGFSSFIDR